MDKFRLTGELISILNETMAKLQKSFSEEELVLADNVYGFANCKGCSSTCKNTCKGNCDGGCTWK